MAKDINQLQNDYDTLKRVHDSTNNALLQSMKENEDLRVQNRLLSARDKQVSESRSVADGIIQQTMDRANALNNKYLEEIEALKVRVRELEGK